MSPITTGFRRDFASEITRYRAVAELTERDMDRTVVAANQAGIPQGEIAKMLTVSQAAVSKRLGKAARLPTDDSPYDVALRRNAGKFSRDEMIERLINWDYLPRQTGFDEPMVDVPGSIDEVIRAHDSGFLSDEEYDTILKGIQAKAEERR
jgi:hypothetical protein